MLPGDNMNWSFSKDRNVVHLEEMCGPSAGSYLTIALISVSPFLKVSHCIHARMDL